MQINIYHATMVFLRVLYGESFLHTVCIDVKSNEKIQKEFESFSHNFLRPPIIKVLVIVYSFKSFKEGSSVCCHKYICQLLILYA